MRRRISLINSSYYFNKKHGLDTLYSSRTKTGFHSTNRALASVLLSPIDSSLRLVAIGIIGFYQRHLSQRKGYSCAHRIVHGGQSCSEYVKIVLADKSLLESTVLARQRFRECNIANISSKNRIAESRDLAMGPGGETEICGCFVAIFAALFALISGKKCAR